MVSLGADLSNRAPTFDMDVSELFEQTDEHTTSTSEIISYAQAREFFARDPSRQWAAYVGGCIIVLMREKGLVLQGDEGNLSQIILTSSLFLFYSTIAKWRTNNFFFRGGIYPSIQG